jgi:hypothetical protein
MKFNLENLKENLSMYLTLIKFSSVKSNMF